MLGFEEYYPGDAYPPPPDQSLLLHHSNPLQYLVDPSRISLATPQSSTLHQSSSVATSSKLPPRKKTHNAIEKKYRNNINDRISQLKAAVPALAHARLIDSKERQSRRKARMKRKGIMSASNADDSDDSDDSDLELIDGVTVATKLNKASILKKATDYINYLKGCRGDLQEEVDRLKMQLALGGTHTSSSESSNSSLPSTPIEETTAFTTSDLYCLDTEASSYDAISDISSMYTDFTQQKSSRLFAVLLFSGCVLYSPIVTSVTDVYEGGRVDGGAEKSVSSFPSWIMWTLILIFLTFKILQKIFRNVPRLSMPSSSPHLFTIVRNSIAIQARRALGVNAISRVLWTSKDSSAYFMSGRWISEGLNGHEDIIKSSNRARVYSTVIKNASGIIGGQGLEYTGDAWVDTILPCFADPTRIDDRVQTLANDCIIRRMTIVLLSGIGQQEDEVVKRCARILASTKKGKSVDCLIGILAMLSACKGVSRREFYVCVRKWAGSLGSEDAGVIMRLVRSGGYGC